MKSYKILSVGDKLKNLREKYNLRQEDLAGDEITRNLISQIEHNKAKLTKNAATVIIKNLIAICKEHKFDLNECVNYLMEDEKGQASKILDTYIKELKDLSIYKDNTFCNKLNEVEEFLANWDFKDKKIAIFELAGDYFCNINDFYNSSIYYEKVKALIDMNNSNENIISILRKLSMVYFYMGKYEADIKCCEFAINKITNMNNEYYYIFVFNSALCYIELKEYKKALNRLSAIEETIKKVNMDKYYEVLMSKAICFQELKEYRKSLGIYDILSEYIDKDNYEKQILILVNTSEIYIELSKYDLVEKNLNIIMDNIGKLNNDNNELSRLYFEMSKIYKSLNNLKKAEDYCSKSLNYAKKTNNYHMLNNIFIQLIDIYTLTKNNKAMTNIKNEFFMLTGKENKLDTAIMYKLIGFYLNTEDIQSLKEIYAFTEKFV
ncbi:MULTISPECIES: helix-turn-helix domain-containing protein [Clostridium]|uniref:helix-turn-helix domain-containing protein n=1 Tax=Clostridium TaxID=1485 RepID=UPI0008259209|nr:MULTISPECIES: helix-turn-helix transcriptional regulator [Clostridium]PJI06913.1 XRE family transcriptional regulator [Clostridium sp. CT7]